ncbi:MAG: hypothetical protein ABIR24_14880 [Verrucomicrobiota bacterium]
MKRHITLLLAMATLLSACSTTPSKRAFDVRSSVAKTNPQSPLEIEVGRDYDYNPAAWLKNPFHSYEEVLKFVARVELLPQNQEAYFQLAADSELERTYPEAIGELVVLRPDYRAESRFGVRGAQGQGRYYAFQVSGREWKLVGIFSGNYLRWERNDKEIIVFPHWHSSAFDNFEDDAGFVWNGKFFERR